MNKHEFTVTRQHQWPDGDLVVEISQGELDYANAGMLVEKYRRLGEGETFVGMTHAVEAGIAVARAWQQDSPDETILIAAGNTGGYTMPFEGQDLTEEVEADLRKQAAEFDENLPRCDHCGDILQNERWRSYLSCFDEVFCSENCVENFNRHMMEDDEGDCDDD